MAAWLKEATGAQLEGVSMDEFRRRLGKAVEEMGPKDGGVLAQVQCSAVQYTDTFVRLFSEVARPNDGDVAHGARPPKSMMPYI